MIPGKIANATVVGRIRNTSGLDNESGFFSVTAGSGLSCQWQDRHMPMSKSEERGLYVQVLAVVNRYDFCGLQPGAEGGPPIDEYEPEARPMESILIDHGRIDVADIQAIWYKWFSDDLFGREAAVASMADELNALLPQNPS